MADTSLQVVPVQAAQERPSGIEYSSEQLRLIADMYAKGATENELGVFIEISKRTGLDIFGRQIYLIPRWDFKLKREIRVPQTSIDGYRLIAERTRVYGGQVGPWWCGEDGAWKDVWLAKVPPSAAKVGVIRKDWSEPLYAVARYDAYVQTDREGNANSMWRKMPDNQLAKCAEALALRKAFPRETSGLYTQEEMAGQETQPEEHAGSPEPQAKRERNTPTVKVAGNKVVVPDAPATHSTRMQQGKISDIITELQKRHGVTIPQLKAVMEKTVGVGNRQALSMEQADRMIVVYGDWLREADNMQVKDSAPAAPAQPKPQPQPDQAEEDEDYIDDEDDEEYEEDDE